MTEHYCKEHGCKFYKNEKDGKTWYSHKIKNEEGYCNEPPEKKQATQEIQVNEITPEVSGGEMTKANWAEKDRTTRKSIERQTSLNAAVEIAKLFGVEKITNEKLIAIARLFENYLETGK